VRPVGFGRIEFGWSVRVDCICCGSAVVTQRSDVTAQGYRRFRCRDCGKQFNERSGGVLNRTSLPSDIIALVVFCRLRYRLTLRDLSEILLLRGFTVSHETIGTGKPSFCPSWVRLCASGGRGCIGVPAGVGMSTRRISRSRAAGAISSGQSTGTET